MQRAYRQPAYSTEWRQSTILKMLLCAEWRQLQEWRRLAEVNPHGHELVQLMQVRGDRMSQPAAEVKVAFGLMTNLHVVLVMLTQGYMSSWNCRRELVEALRVEKKILVLRETDPNHGAITLSALKEEVEVLPEQSDRNAGNEIVRMFEAGEALEWHREGHLKRAVLAAIVQAILELQAPSGAPAVRVVPMQYQARLSRSEQRPVQVHLLAEYEAAAPVHVASPAGRRTT